MYEAHYGLRELPFELTPNPKFLFMTSQHREALSNLQYGLSSSKPMILLVGEAGMGKTTLLRTALASDACRHVHCVYLCNPTLNRRDFVRTLAEHFELGAQATESKAALLRELSRLLHERGARGERTALVIDEAQSLSNALFEEIRLLANIETSTTKLLTVVLAGQPELAERLEEPALRQLKQRVALRCEIPPMSSRDTAAYIATRIKAAGGTASRMFSLEAVEAIHRFSGGIPRVINVICDNALVSSVAAQRHPVDQAIILDVCRDFALRATEDAGTASTESVTLVDDAEAGPTDGSTLPTEEPTPSREYGNGPESSGFVSNLKRLLSPRKGVRARVADV